MWSHNAGWEMFSCQGSFLFLQANVTASHHSRGCACLPILLQSEGFHCVLKTKVKNRKGPRQQTNNS